MQPIVYTYCQRCCFLWAAPWTIWPFRQADSFALKPFLSDMKKHWCTVNMRGKTMCKPSANILEATKSFVPLRRVDGELFHHMGRTTHRMKWGILQKKLENWTNWNVAAFTVNYILFKFILYVSLVQRRTYFTLGRTTHRMKWGILQKKLENWTNWNVAAFTVNYYTVWIHFVC